MFSITPRLLDNYPYTLYADPQSIRRGHSYYNDNRVWDVTLSKKNSRAVCMVDGDSGEYTVEIEVSQKTGELSFDCDCPYAESHFCKHMVAAALELSAYLKDEDDYEEDQDDDVPILFPKPQIFANWQSKLNETLSVILRRTPANNSNRYVTLVLMSRSKYGYGYGSAYRTQYSYSLEPFIVRASEWSSLTGGTITSPQEVDQFLDTNKKWIKSGEVIRQQLNPAGSLNLKSDAVAFLNAMQNFARMYGGGSGNMSMYLSMLATLDIPVFLGSLYPSTIYNRLHILP
jgi:hypothetical protein